MPDDLPFVPDATLDVVDAGWWLDLCCACGRSTSIPHRPLAKRHGVHARVPDLLVRLRCSQSLRSCGAGLPDPTNLGLTVPVVSHRGHSPHRRRSPAGGHGDADPAGHGLHPEVPTVEPLPHPPAARDWLPALFRDPAFNLAHGEETAEDGAGLRFPHRPSTLRHHGRLASARFPLRHDPYRRLAPAALGRDDAHPTGNRLQSENPAIQRHRHRPAIRRRFPGSLRDPGFHMADADERAERGRSAVRASASVMSAVSCRSRTAARREFQEVYEARWKPAATVALAPPRQPAGGRGARIGHVGAVTPTSPGFIRCGHGSGVRTPACG